MAPEPEREDSKRTNGSASGLRAAAVGSLGFKPSTTAPVALGCSRAWPCATLPAIWKNNPQIVRSTVCARLVLASRATDVLATVGGALLRAPWKIHCFILAATPTLMRLNSARLGVQLRSVHRAPKEPLQTFGSFRVGRARAAKS
eukprot:1927213-Alexandrium_andersonii.AAC.1